MTSIASKRNKIYALIIQKRFGQKGRNNPTSFNGVDIRALFLLYDKYFFDNKIMEKIKTCGSVHFVTKGKNLDCGVNVKQQPSSEGQSRIKYFVDISPLKVVEKCQNIGIDKMQSIQALLEDGIIHLLMQLHNYKENNQSSGAHGGTFNALYKSFFFQDLPHQVRSLPANFQNSCFLDSLVFSMLISPIEEIKNILFKNTRDSNRDLISYTLQNYVKIINSPSDGKYFYFKILRERLQKIFPENTDLGSGQFTVSMLYDIFTDLFPELKMTEIPTRVIKKSKQSAIKVKNEEYSSFQMWDFIDPHTKSLDYHGEVVVWDKIKNPYLVFQFHGMPDIKSFKTPDGKGFDEFIIDCKYELCIAIINHGAKPTLTSPGGSHYTAFIKDNSDLKWYFYDDSRPSYTQVDKLPVNIFKNTNISRPEMYFYKRII
ncbi:ubiquitin carboxyl-terminal hydrolase [bacterium]|nr:ubiquitin carboxyl-terminal hydrolase [bacterium]